ncbi:fibroblast growth factor receptor 3-like isoform X2 [Oscarella lobularis]|uniref:fibroblast growth factor receptor 3-like isoform X2 n=1 Tax=Oscarella lobularis TaxID=121494 RepID=UPI003313FB36
MNSSLILVIGYLLLSIGSSLRLAKECFCKRNATRITNETIPMTRQDVVRVTCTQNPANFHLRLRWKAFTESKSSDAEGVQDESQLVSVVTIRGASINASQSIFSCRLVDDTFPEKSPTCCTVIIKKITETSTTAATKMTPTQQEERNYNSSTTTYISSAIAVSTTNSYTTLQQEPNASTDSPTTNYSYLNWTSFQNASSALKRKRLSDKLTLNDSTDNLAYLLDAKGQQVWTGSKIIPIDCLSIGITLGEGQFGTVAEGKLRYASEERKIYDKRIALKMLRDQEGINAEALQKEAEFIVNLGQHENVIHVYGYCIEEKCVSKIVMEYAELGDLHRHLRKLRSVGLDDAKQFAFAQQIAEGMNYVVSKGCVHRDLAARNVLVCEGERLKISDFGFAKDLQSAAYYRKTSRGGVIPFRWCAPEVLLYRTYSEYSDVWSYGIVLWEIATLGGTPYPGIPVEKLFELLTGSSGYRMSKPRNCSQKLYGVMVRCWNSVPDTRPTFISITSEYVRTNGPQAL